MDVDFRKLVDHPVYSVTVAGIDVVVHPGIFAPDSRYSRSTDLMVKHLPDLAGKDVLDLGCGTGVMAVVAAKRGARHVVAADIDPSAIRNAEANVHKHRLEGVVHTVVSDLFSHVPGSFDCILANLPIWDELWTMKTTTTTLAEEFFRRMGDHLNPGSIVLFAWFSIAPVEPVRTALAASGFTFEEFTEDGLGFTWYLFVAHKA